MTPTISSDGSRDQKAGPVRVVMVLGTRPEAIKMAPLILAARAVDEISLHVCSTGQHREMLDETLRAFNLKADSDLGIMRPNQTLADITVEAVKGVHQTLVNVPCDWLLVQGDTTSAFAASLAAFYSKVKVGHVEAGLRTGNMAHPWPEEANRRLVSVVANRHYAPTERARDNLLRENIPADEVIVTGNTVIDALLAVVARLETEADLARSLDRKFPWLDNSRRMILVTGHRRESFGDGFQNICRALKEIAQRGDVQIVYPVHLNPNVRGPVFELLSGLDNVHLIEPVDYISLVYLLKRCHFVLTDSGGIQEEAPSLLKPVLVMRSTSERMEAIDAGAARLVGTNPTEIISGAVRLLDNSAAYEAMRIGYNPFGDGKAAARIIQDLLS